MRGDHMVACWFLSKAAGPPPHARGSLPARPHRRHVRRPTPACAGITRTAWEHHHADGAHPRMRGDHAHILGTWDGVSGPPPHARGSRALGCEHEAGHGPTPACAGITGRLVARPRRARAHPRMRGDHRDARERNIDLGGPPPHARGSRVLLPAGRQHQRPTPACAGITTLRRLYPHLTTAHPRMRGDHPSRARGAGRCGGPPPHARGSRRAEAREHGTHGPTPACAGITRSRAGRSGGAAAHPRMRGDHVRRKLRYRSNRGPPPHARGSPPAPERQDGGARPTPACAGITCRCWRGWRVRRAHPRMRGDHPPAMPASRAGGGPPPHARGSPASSRPRGWR